MGKWVGCQILSLLRRWVEWWDGTYVNFLMKSPLQNPQGIITNANNVCLIAVDYSHEFKLQCKWLKFAPLICLDWSQLLSIFMDGRICVKPNISCLCACAGHVRRPPRRRTYAFQPQNGRCVFFLSYIYVFRLCRQSGGWSAATFVLANSVAIYLNSVPPCYWTSCSSFEIFLMKTSVRTFCVRFFSNNFSITFACLLLKLNFE